MNKKIKLALIGTALLFLPGSGLILGVYLIKRALKRKSSIKNVKI